MILRCVSVYLCARTRERCARARLCVRACVCVCVCVCVFEPLSQGKPVNIWCATICWWDDAGNECERHLALFYDKDRPGQEKGKNGNTGSSRL